MNLTKMYQSLTKLNKNVIQIQDDQTLKSNFWNPLISVYFRMIYKAGVNKKFSTSIYQNAVKLLVP